MQHPDEGVIHAWIDGALDREAARELEAHLAECADCARVAAEARGLVAASSRILTALDNVPGDVIPAARPAMKPPQRVRPWATPFWMRTAASVLIVAGISALFVTGKLNSPEWKRGDIPAVSSEALPPMKQAAITVDTIASAPVSVLASAPPAARQASAPAAPVAAPQPFSARGGVSSSGRQNVTTGSSAKDVSAAMASKEQDFSDKLAREERIAEADQAQKSLEKKAVVAAAPPTEPVRRDAAANTAADVRGVLSAAQTSAGRAAAGSSRSGQSAATPSMTAPTAQSMAAPSEIRRELTTSTARARAVTGCYELTLSPWSGGTIPFGAPPARIELDSLTSVQPSIRGLKLVHPARGAASNGTPLAYWRMFGDSVFVTWRDDQRGVNLVLPAGNEVTQGSARTFSTLPDDGFAQRAEVEARRISCRE